MRIEDFDYELPEEFIAQEPKEPRDESRLMVLHRDLSLVEHRKFRDIINYLNPCDTLVLNDTRVVRARLCGVREGTGGKVELLLLERLAGDTWEALVKPGRSARIGSRVLFGKETHEAELVGEFLDRTPAGGRIVRFYGGPVDEALERLGKVPLPPYIKKELACEGRYQTVYAKKEGSVAAPTAGLHFTEELLGEIRNKGIEVVFVTLHIGIGTFRPVKVVNIEDHEMHEEAYWVPEETAERLNKTRSAGGRIVVVGTTAARALESVTFESGTVEPGHGRTGIFIHPGYRFKSVDTLVTNFHLPRSTLLMLVCAFAGRDKILEAYKLAVREGYRFFSFGDAMLIL